MGKTKLVFDVDDVILRTVDSVISMYNIVARENGKRELSDDKNEKCESKSWIEIIFDEYGSLKNFNNLFCREIHGGVEVNKGIVNFIKRISEESEVFLFTKPHSIKELSEKLNIIHDLFGEVGEQINGVITVTGDELHKGMLNIEGPFVFVDDRYTNLTKVEADYKIMYSIWKSDTEKAINDDSMDVAFSEEELINKIEQVINNEMEC